MTEFFETDKDYIPITHTIECHIPKRHNRINKEVAKQIKHLYIDEIKTIQEISSIIGKTEEAIEKFLIKEKIK